MNFLWNNDLSKPKFESLKSDIKTDVLIIGGGMAGVLCAYELQRRGVDYALLEANSIGQGITKGTTAVLTAQHDTLYQDIIKKNGADQAKQYLDANLEALKSFKKLCLDFDCDFETKPSIIYSLTDKKQMVNEVDALKSIGFAAAFLKKIPLPLDVAGAVEFSNMAQFHPLKFLYSVSKNLNIYENTFVYKMKGTTAFTQSGKVEANKIIIATHFPFINSHGFYFGKMYQKRSYVIAFEHAPNLGCTIEDICENGFYFRNYKDLLLIGGGDHRTGKSGGGYDAVLKFAQKYFSDAKEQYRWSNQDCVTLDGIPYIGQYSSAMPNVYVATGFNLWGMTTSMAAANILCDMIEGKENKNAEVFSPNRSILHAQLFKNLGATTVDMLTPTTKRCSHLGCALKWNKLEHSWDCPCHGSRFDEKGRIIDNPAMRDSDV